MSASINLKLILGILLIIFSLSRATAGITIEPTYSYGQQTAYYAQYQPSYGYDVRYKKCIGNTIYVESTMPNGSKTWQAVYTCKYDEDCIDGSCFAKPSKISIGSWEISLGPCCSEAYLKQFCLGNELWAIYRNSKCVATPKFIQRCAYGCSNGRCNSAPQPIYVPTSINVYYQYYTPSKPQVPSYTLNVYTYQSNVAPKPKCNEGFVCVGTYWKAYRNSNCEIVPGTYTYCQYGCKNGACAYARCTIPNGFGPYCECDNDGDCPIGYYCKHTFTYDRCVPIMDP